MKYFVAFGLDKTPRQMSDKYKELQIWDTTRAKAYNKFVKRFGKPPVITWEEKVKQ